MWSKTLLTILVLSSAGVRAQSNPAESAVLPSPAGPDGIVPLIPPRLVECEGSGPCNAAWLLGPTGGTATWFAQTNTTARLTVVRFQPDDILIRRTDTSDGNSAVYAGAQHGDHYSGTVIWSRPDHPGESSGVWTASIPQTVCAPGDQLSAKDAMRIGQNALMFQLRKDAQGCYLVAAKDGDVIAQTLVGMLYYQGHDPDVPQDYAQALVWLKKAAAQGSYSAQRTVADMYMLGEGTAANPEISRYYAAKADEQLRARERAEDRADRQADQNKMLSGFVMGAVFGALVF